MAGPAAIGRFSFFWGAPNYYVALRMARDAPQLWLNAAEIRERGWVIEPDGTPSLTEGGAAQLKRYEDSRTIDPPPIYKTIDRAISEIYKMKERTCASVAEVLRRLPIHEWDEDTRRRVANELWQLSNQAVWPTARRCHRRL